MLCVPFCRIRYFSHNAFWDQTRDLGLSAALSVSPSVAACRFTVLSSVHSVWVWLVVVLFGCGWWWCCPGGAYRLNDGAKYNDVVVDDGEAIMRVKTIYTS